MVLNILETWLLGEIFNSAQHKTIKNPTIFSPSSLTGFSRILLFLYKQPLFLN